MFYLSYNIIIALSSKIYIYSLKPHPSNQTVSVIYFAPLYRTVVALFPIFYISMCILYW